LRRPVPGRLHSIAALYAKKIGREVFLISQGVAVFPAMLAVVLLRGFFLRGNFLAIATRDILAD